METTSIPDPFPGHDAGLWSPVPSSIAASWPVGSFAENIAVDKSGTVFVSLHSHNRVERYDPTTKTLATFLELPAPATGLAFDASGALWITGGTVGQAPGFMWRATAEGAVAEWLQIPDAVFLNGCTPHPDGRTLLVCESATGRVLAVDQHNPGYETWLEADLLRPLDPQTPGANGIKIHNGSAYISVTGKNLLLRAAVNANGSAGPLQIAAENLRADDFAFAESGNLYIATHPAQSVLRLAPDAARTTIAGPAEGAVGGTACAFGRAPGDAKALYVTTNGGLYAPYKGEIQEAKLLRLEIGEAGQRLLPD